MSLASSERPAQARRRVAIVDDDESVRRALGRLLGACGFETAPYPSAEAFLQDEGRDVDCLVLDLQLGGMTGFELKERLDAEGASPPTIFVTAHATPENQAVAERIGCVAYFDKPIHSEALLAAIHEALRSD